ncbi:dual OB domain-containing protein [Aeromonas veronii]
MMSTRLVLLAASVKRKHYCIAGKKWHQDEANHWIRPVGNSLPDNNDALTATEIEFQNHKIPAVLDVVDMHLLAPADHPIQAENILVDTSVRWEKIGTMPFNQLSQFIETPDTLWLNPNSHYGINDCFPSNLLKTKVQSLYFILIESLTINISHSTYDNRKRYHGSFIYNGIKYKLSITDANIYSEYRDKVDGEYAYGKCYATVSMALFAERNECYKFLAALIKIKD